MKATRKHAVSVRLCEAEGCTTFVGAGRRLCHRHNPKRTAQRRSEQQEKLELARALRDPLATITDDQDGAP